MIGLPGAGRKTIFEALTQTSLDSTHLNEDKIVTINVPDERVDALSRRYEPQKTIFAQIEYILPAETGAKTDGGDQPLIRPALRDCDALLHVVRNHSALGDGNKTPAADFAAIDQELLIADLMSVEKRIERVELDHRRGKKMDTEEHVLLKKCRMLLDGERPLRSDPVLASAKHLRGFALLSAKPMLVLFNNDDDDDAIPGPASAAPGEHCMSIQGKIEQELAQLTPEEAVEFMQEFDIQEPARQRIIQSSYRLLGLISFFTVGKDEVRAWTVPEGTTAAVAAGTIHSDMQKGFIRAEVLAYDDLEVCGSYPEARKQGKVRLEGKTYPVADGDIIEIRFNV
jgi:GTP-binding protein YchF